MPSAPLRYCSTPGCPERVGPSKPCPIHTRTAIGGWQSQGKARRQIAGRKLQRLKRELAAEEPFCRLCRQAVATIRDHIIPLAEGGTDDRQNIQHLCQDCSDRKTREEAMRGRLRSR